MSKVYEAYLALKELEDDHEQAFWEANNSENEEISGNSEVSTNDEEVRDGL